MTEYRALKAFTNGNTYVAKGATASLSDTQAEFLKRGGFVEAVAPAKAAAPRKAAAPAPKAAKAAAPAAETAKAPAGAPATKKADA